MANLNSADLTDAIRLVDLLSLEAHQSSQPEVRRVLLKAALRITKLVTEEELEQRAAA